MRPALLFSLVLTFACGGGSSNSASTATKTGNGVGPASDNAPAHLDSTSSSPEDPALTEKECSALLDHMLRVALAEEQSKRPPDEQPTEADLPVARERQAKQLMPSCVGAPRSRFAYDCAMAAETAQAMRACVGEKASP
jgi:hypothetical protein